LKSGINLYNKLLLTKNFLIIMNKQTILAGTIALSFITATTVTSCKKLGKGDDVRQTVTQEGENENTLKSGDAKCGEGKCGDAKADTTMAKTADGKCGAKKDTAMTKTKEGKCGEGKCA
jgi:uncharacterized low-complexity protein